MKEFADAITEKTKGLPDSSRGLMLTKARATTGFSTQEKSSKSLYESKAAVIRAEWRRNL